MATTSENRSPPLEFQLDGVALRAYPGETILQAARRYQVEIPHLCYRDGLRAEGNCRACMVEIAGERLLAPACCRTPTEGMTVASRSARARAAQRLVLELLRSDVTPAARTHDSELERWCAQLDVGEPRFVARRQPSADHSHPAIAVNLDACIQCTRCLRACREVQVNDVIGFAHRAADVKIVFDLDDALGVSSCVACGECVQACPTGALTDAGELANQTPDRQVASVCPYCGVGCQLTYQLKDDRILRVEGRHGPANRARLCVKGRYGFDYVHHRQRLTKPWVRREDAPKRPQLDQDPEHPLRDFREATWEEAMNRAAEGFQRIKNNAGPHALAGFGSAKGSNEEAYLFQKLVRTGFGTNNVDHCTRLCHASSVAALLQMVGSGAVSNPVADVSETDVILLIGSNAAENHPVAATFFKNAARAGKTLIVLDPRRTPIARHARYALQFKPDTDVALLNAIMHSIIAQDLIDTEFIGLRTEGYAELESHLAAFAPEKMQAICGIPAVTLHEVARVFATARAAMIFWGMGVSQHVHGTDNARCLINLALITGQIGRRGTGLHPLRGQNNVQGASDAGLIPMVFPDYRRVDDERARRDFEDLWDCALDNRPGLTVVEIMRAIHAGTIRGMYILGENPAMSDPHLQESRAALAKLEHLVVQDIFPTETAHYADVILPASAFPEKTGTFTNTDRRIQLGRQALEPPGEARQDLAILLEMAQRLNLDWTYAGPQDVFAEMRLAMPSIAGITWERLAREHAVTYPCHAVGDPGEEVIFTELFPRPGGKALLVPSPLANADELPDADYPKVLITGRQLEHWHTGAMSRRSQVLDALEPIPVASLNAAELARAGLQAGAAMRLSTRRGSIVAQARVDDGLQDGQVFLPFAYQEAAANLLTNAALDPDGKIPEFKFCAVKVDPAG